MVEVELNGRGYYFFWIMRCCFMLGLGDVYGILRVISDSIYGLGIEGDMCRGVGFGGWGG